MRENPTKRQKRPPKPKPVTGTPQYLCKRVYHVQEMLDWLASMTRIQKKQLVQNYFREACLADDIERTYRFTEIGMVCGILNAHHERLEAETVIKRVIWHIADLIVVVMIEHIEQHLKTSEYCKRDGTYGDWRYGDDYHHDDYYRVVLAKLQKDIKDAKAAKQTRQK